MVSQNLTLGALNITKRLSGIHAAWHFWYAVGFGGESGLRKLGLSGTHSLTQRYV
ncbi:Glutathione S-transferase [Vibrio vulnificus]|nr:Glutathione S-transferase [Vibrio vulnificus]